jgi:hypothetical protein
MPLPASDRSSSRTRAALWQPFKRLTSLEAFAVLAAAKLMTRWLFQKRSDNAIFDTARLLWQYWYH